MKSTILIAWFLVSLMDGTFQYRGPFSEADCQLGVKLMLAAGASYAYCTEAE